MRGSVIELAAIFSATISVAAISAAVISTAACGSQRGTLAPAGSERDEGHGELAKMSRTLITAEEGSEPDPFAVDPKRVKRREFGGSTYASYDPPSWPVVAVDREPSYDEDEDAAGAIEGTVTWRAATASANTRTAANDSSTKPQLQTSCGSVPSPLQVSAGGGLGGVIVYIERVERGRPLPMDSRPSTVGGIVTKRGCAFLPTAQILTPLPAPVIVHGDQQRVRIRIGSRPPLDLQEGGRVSVQQAAIGVTRIDDAAATHGAAWVVALETPAYAVTDDRGRYRLDELSPGTYEVTFWQAPLATITNGALSYGSPIVTKRKVIVRGSTSSRLDVALGTSAR